MLEQKHRIFNQFFSIIGQSVIVRKKLAAQKMRRIFYI